MSAIKTRKDTSWIRTTDEENVDEETEDSPTTQSAFKSVEAIAKRFGGMQEMRSPTKTETFSERVLKAKGNQYTPFSPPKTTKVPETVPPTKDADNKVNDKVIPKSTKDDSSPVDRNPYTPSSPTKTTKVPETVTPTKDADNKVNDKVIPKSTTDDSSPVDSKTSVTTTETVLVRSSSGTDAEDKLFNTLVPQLPADGKTKVSSTETVTVRSGTNGDYKTTTTTRTSSTAEDELYGTLLPKAITSGLDSPISSSSTTTSTITRREFITVESSRGVESQIVSSPSSTLRSSYSSYTEDLPSTRTTSYTVSTKSSSDSYDDDGKKYSSYSSYTEDLPSTRTTSYTVSTKSSDSYDDDSKRYSYTKPDSSYEYSSSSGPSSITSTTYRTTSRSDSSDPYYSKSSTKSVYSSSDRTLLEKDLCSVCRNPFTGDAKMVLDDIKINCHVTCFKCQVCNNTLSHLKAGDSMWVYKNMVHCENCFENTRERWRR